MAAWDSTHAPILSLSLSLFPSLMSRLISEREMERKVVIDAFDATTMPVVSRVIQKLIKSLLN